MGMEDSSKVQKGHALQVQRPVFYFKHCETAGCHLGTPAPLIVLGNIESEHILFTCPSIESCSPVDQVHLGMAFKSPESCLEVPPTHP